MTAVAVRDERLLWAGEGVACPWRAALAWVEGPDALRFLQGTLTADVAALPVGGAGAALLLTGKGRILGELSVLREGAEAYTLAMAAEAGPRVTDALTAHLVAEDAELIGPEPVPAAIVAGASGPPRAPDGDLVVPWVVPGTWLVISGDGGDPLARLAVPAAGPDAITLWRVAVGAPEVGADLPPDAALVHEAGLEHRLVSFTKGCYLGQETVARSEHRGRVRRLLRGLRLTAPVPDGAEVSRDGAAVGRATSVVVSERLGPVALALLRREVAPGAAVTVEGVAATVAALPLMDPQRAA